MFQGVVSSALIAGSLYFFLEVHFLILKINYYSITWLWLRHRMPFVFQKKLAQSDLGGENKTSYRKLQKITQIPSNLGGIE